MKLNPLKTSLILFLIISTQLYAQGKDDLCKEWEKVSDTINNYNNYLDYNYSMLTKVGSKCKVDIFITNGFIYQKQQKNDSAISNFSNAIKIGKELNLTKEIIPAYTNKAYVFAQTNKIKEANTLLKEAKAALDKTPDNKDWNLYFQARAYLADISSNYDDAIAYMDSSIVFSKRIKSNTFEQNGYVNRGTYLLRKSDYEAAAASFLKGIELSEKSGKADGLESYYHMVGFCYTRWEQHETALTYYKKARDRAKKASNNYILMYNYSRESRSLLALNLIDDAMVSIDSAIILAKKYNDNGILGNAYNNKGSAYFKHIKDYEKAELYYTKSYESSLKANSSKKSDDLLKFSSIQGMLNVYMQKKNYKKAKIFLNVLEDEANKSGLLMYKEIFNKYSSNYYEAIGQPGKAIKYLREEYKIKDSISSDNVKTQVAKLEKQYNTTSKELQIVKLDKAKVEQEQLTAKAKTKQNLYLITAIILLSLLILGYWLFRKLKKQKEELDTTNKVKNRLFSIIAHDLRGMIIPFQRSGRILEHYIEEKNYDKTITFSKELQKNSQGLSTMLDNLLSWSIEQMNGYKMNPELLYVTKEINEIKTTFSQQSEFKDTKINIVNSEEIAINIDKGAFHIIFRNLIGNALKYTENGIIRIEFKRDLNTLTCILTDTGIGMSKAQLDNIFTLDTKESTIGTKGEKGTGLGLSLVYRFVKMNGGTIKVSSEKRVGTKFNLNFPLSENDILETEKINTKEQSA
ncbi:ATP-binding protein [uncultured Lacinutrix sp.]|uniref:ATP-binding protein n=1 Tax=uncultured Lacinutrix sp. TaxID=574032 RepID=UPI0026052226|nr:ATP-binding protein [uncultured Lacinutrix sp.]